MARLLEAPHGWLDDFEQKASSAGLTAEQLKMLNTDPHRLNEWIGSLPDPEQTPMPIAQLVAVDAKRVPLEVAFPERGALYYLLSRLGFNWLDDLSALCEWEVGEMQYIGPSRLKRIKEALERHDMYFDVHPRSQCRFFTPSQGKTLLRERAGGLGLSEVAPEAVRWYRLNPGRYNDVTLDHFRRMSEEQRGTLFSSNGIELIRNVIDRFQL